MAYDTYGTLAGVYEWLVPEGLLTPEGSVSAFEAVVSSLGGGARVLDCAAGIGQLAVGLVLRGFEVVASDASSAMIERTQALAAQRGVHLPAVVCSWAQLDRQGWRPFDAVFCVGNSLTHAPGRAGRRAALRAMGRVLRDGGLLILTSRNWELVRLQGSGLHVADQLTQREGQQGLAIYAWTVADSWEDPHYLDVAVALIDQAGRVTTQGERLPFWPFSHRMLDDDLRAAGLTLSSSTYEHEAERYLVTARPTGIL